MVLPRHRAYRAGPCTLHGSSLWLALLDFDGLVPSSIALATSPWSCTDTFVSSSVCRVIYGRLRTERRYSWTALLVYRPWLHWFVHSTLTSILHRVEPSSVPVGGQVGARVLNKVYAKLKAKNGGVGTPEMRSVMILLAFPSPLRHTKISSLRRVCQTSPPHGDGDHTARWPSHLWLDSASTHALDPP